MYNMLQPTMDVRLNAQTSLSQMKYTEKCERLTNINSLMLYEFHRIVQFCFYDKHSVCSHLFTTFIGMLRCIMLHLEITKCSSLSFWYPKMPFNYGGFLSMLYYNF